MSRPLRIEFPGAVYHVTSRGNGGQEVFSCDGDRELFLDSLHCAARRYGLLVHAYCLMRDHYHLLLETEEANLSRAMQRVNGDYTQAFNRRHGRAGHLFGGRFKAVLVQKETHLLEAARHVVLNPVRAGFAKGPERWRWSSYSATAGLEEQPPFLHTRWVLSRFDRSRDKAAPLYRKFVTGAVGMEGSPFEDVVAQMVLGTEEFVLSWLDQVDKRREMREYPRFQRRICRPPVDKVLKAGRGAGREELAERVREAHVHHGYTLGEIAEHLGVHYSTAGRLLKMAMEKRR